MSFLKSAEFGLYYICAILRRVLWEQGEETRAWRQGDSGWSFMPRLKVQGMIPAGTRLT